LTPTPTPIRLIYLACLIYLAAPTAAAQELPVSAGTEQDTKLFEEARLAVHETQFEKADDLLRQLLKDDPEFGLGWGYFAVIDMMLYRDPTESIARARADLDEASAGERAMTEILIQFALNDLEQSESLILDFLDRFSEDRFANHLLGWIYNDSGRPEDGISVLRELIRMHPDYVPAWNHLGYAFMEAGDLTKARASFEMFLELSTDNPSAHDSLAEVLAREGEVEKAISQLRRALEIEPRMAFAWMHMGDILADAGLTEQAESAYKKAGDASLLYGDDFRDELAERIRDIMENE